MNSMTKYALAGLLALGSATQCLAQRYEVGIRSALITGTMELSRLDPAFDDLANDGVVGPHMSGFFFMVRVRPHVQVGVETLVSNSDKAKVTTMNYQAAGPVVRLSYGNSWFIGGGVHAGGLIVNAMRRQGAAPATGAATGSFYKADGYFAAPYLDLGRRFRRTEVGVFVKAVRVFGESDGLDGFNASFVGVRLAIGL